MNLCVAWPRLMDPDQARTYVGGREIFEAMKRANLVSPKFDRKRLVRYDKIRLDLACDNIKPEDLDGSGS